MPKIETVIETITPGRAYEYLDKNTHNRAVRDTVVARYAQMMRKGQWELTHQGIAFDSEGRILDGQHRLWAVIESGATIKIPVSRGYDPEVMLAIDQNFNRTAVDSINLMTGSNLKNLHASTARSMMGGMPQVVQKRGDIYQLYEFIDKHQKVLDKTVAMFTPKKVGVSQSAVLAVIARALYHAPEDRLKSFVNVLRNGIMEHATETPAILLRNFLLTKAKASTHAPIIYAKAERALKAFLDKEEITVLYATADELFPLPGEKMAKVATKSARFGSVETREKAAKTRMANAEKKRNAGLPVYQPRGVKVIKSAAKTAKAS